MNTPLQDHKPKVLTLKVIGYRGVGNIATVRGRKVVAIFPTALQYFPRRCNISHMRKNQTNQKLYEFSVKADSLKGVVDKILESVANFHGHF